MHATASAAGSRNLSEARRVIQSPALLRLNLRPKVRVARLRGGYCIVAAPMKRTYYMDRLRVVLTALVVLHHTAITYGAPGGWYYHELPLTLSLSGLALILFVSINQAYF